MRRAAGVSLRVLRLPAGGTSRQRRSS
jgi:hypothetical protein